MFLIRNTTIDDVPTILSFIQQLAKYEKLEHEVVATQEHLRKTLFGHHPKAEVILAFVDSKPIGFALFFSNYSTFLGRAGLHLEDLFVLKEHRGHGYGKALLKHVASIATQRKAGRLEWNVLNWNTPAIDFYKSVGAVPMHNWQTFRLDEQSLHIFVNS